MCGSAALKAFNSLHQVLDLASARARSSSRLRLRLHLRYSSGLGFFRCCRTGEDQIMRAETCQRPAGERPHVRSRSEEHTSELQSLMRIYYAVFCLIKNTTFNIIHTTQKISTKN